MFTKPLAIAFLIASLPLANLAQPQPQPSGPYSVMKIQLVGGDGGFDYVTADPDGRNLYVARSGPGGHIGVFNLDTLAQVGDIPGTSAHGGAVDTATGHGFATSKPVTMFDAKTFAVIKKIDVEGNPDGYLNDAYNHHFYVLSHSAPNITVLDDKDGSILGTIDIGGAPEQAATDGHGKIYVDIVRQGRDRGDRRGHDEDGGRNTIYRARAAAARAWRSTPRTASCSPPAAKKTTW